VKIISIPNDNDSVMNSERQRIVPWAPAHGWTYTGYNNESDHLAQIKRVAAGQPMEVLDFDCHGSPSQFDHTYSATALQFGKSVAGIPGFSGNTAIYLDACNTGLTSNFASVAIAQTVADGAGCTVFGTKGYMTGTFAENNERCFRGPNLNPPLPAYPGAQDAQGRNVWIAFRPRGASASPARRVGEGLVADANSVTVHAADTRSAALAAVLDRVMSGVPIEFPALRMAPDATITYVRAGDARILDVFANGGLLKDRVAGTAWRVENADELAGYVRQLLA
jgi:hypothetical protein